MTAVLDITSDPFAGVFGTSRGTADRALTSTISDSRDFTDAIEALRADRGRAGAASLIDALVTYALADHRARQDGRIAADLVARAKPLPAITPTNLDTCAREHILAALDTDGDDVVERTHQTLLDLQAQYLSVCVHRFAALEHILSDWAFSYVRRCAQSSTGLDYRELGGEGANSPHELLSASQWTTIFHTCFKETGPEAALLTLRNSIKTRIDNGPRNA